MTTPIVLIILMLSLLLMGGILFSLRELNRCEDLVRRLEQQAALRRRPHHSQPIFTTARETDGPVFRSTTLRFLQRFRRRRRDQHDQ